MGYFGLKNDASSELWLCCKNFFKILHNKRGQYVDENYINDFFQKIFLFGANGPFWQGSDKPGKPGENSFFLKTQGKPGKLTEF